MVFNSTTIVPYDNDVIVLTFNDLRSSWYHNNNNSNRMEIQLLKCSPLVKLGKRDRERNEVRAMYLGLTTFIMMGKRFGIAPTLPNSYS